LNKIVALAWKDIQEGRNLDLYLTLLVCAVLLFLDIFGVSSFGPLAGGILAVLLILAYDRIEGRRSAQRIEDRITELSSQVAGPPSAMTFFREWDDNLFEARLQTARSVSMLATAPYDVLTRHQDSFNSLLRRGGSLRFLLLKEGMAAAQMATERARGVESELGHLESLRNLSIQRICELVRNGSDATKVQLKVIDHLPSAVITMVDDEDKDGVIFVTLKGFARPGTSRPSFALRQSRDGRWYEFYKSSFDSIWDWQKAETVDLA
jgi:hypothetical protein